MLQKIISGAEAGPDLGALLAAEHLEMNTGGFMPANYRTKSGNKPELAQQFHLKALSSSYYYHRTVQNITLADATLWVGSRSDRQMKKVAFVANVQNKPCLELMWDCATSATEGTSYDAYMAEKVYNWLVKVDPQSLNVTGCVEAKNPGVQRFTKMALQATVGYWRMKANLGKVLQSNSIGALSK